jgi:hypothetical protein
MLSILETQDIVVCEYGISVADDPKLNVNDRRRAGVFRKLREYGRQPPAFTCQSYQSPTVYGACPGKAALGSHSAKTHHAYSATGHWKTEPRIGSFPGCSR